MMQEPSHEIDEERLKGVLEHLENRSRQLRKTQGYNKEVALMHLLQELLKEQSKDEDTGIAARPSR